MILKLNSGNTHNHSSDVEVRVFRDTGPHSDHPLVLARSETFQFSNGSVGNLSDIVTDNWFDPNTEWNKTTINIDVPFYWTFAMSNSTVTGTGIETTQATFTVVRE